MMNKEKALIFLKQYQPLPDDEKLTKELINKYDEVRKYFLINPDKECIPYFLNSFGYVNGFGVYQLIEDVIKLFKSSEVVIHLKNALKSKHRGIRYWCAQIAADFPDINLIDELEDLLQNEDDFDIKYSVITALENIPSIKVKYILKNALTNEDDEELVELLNEVIKNIE